MKILKFSGNSILNEFLFLELDLDYLEDVHSRRRKRATTPLQELSPDSVDLVKVVLLGASRVGKTSLIQVVKPLKSVTPFFRLYLISLEKLRCL